MKEGRERNGERGKRERERDREREREREREMWLGRVDARGLNCRNKQR